MTEGHQQATRHPPQSARGADDLEVRGLPHLFDNGVAHSQDLEVVWENAKTGERAKASKDRRTARAKGLAKKKAGTLRERDPW